MIYLDTSWLVKLYAEEADAVSVRRVADAEDVVIVSEIAYVEFHSALQRRLRERYLTARDAATVVARFRREWTEFSHVAVTGAVLTLGAELVERHPLRTLDALQLASALVVAAGAPDPPRFGAADARLRTAAEAEGLVLAAS